MDDSVDRIGPDTTPRKGIGSKARGFVRALTTKYVHPNLLTEVCVDIKPGKASSETMTMAFFSDPSYLLWRNQEELLHSLASTTGCPLF